MGMVGGGPGSFIGAVHYYAAVLDGKIELVCGSFSSDSQKSMITGTRYFLDPSRIYPTYREMMTRERDLPEHRRMDLVSIVTPNHLHFEPARLALENGFHVVCDKPLCHTTREAGELVKLTEKTGLIFALTYPYISYPVVKEARVMIDSGALGKIRKVVVEYPQGWLSERLEITDNKQAGWRGDPARSGRCGAMADIGVHALNLAEYVTSLKVTELFADLSRVVPGRVLDDDGNILVRFSNGANGIMFATQIAAGEENDVNIRVWGEKGGLEWHHRDPNTLIHKIPGRPAQIIRAGHHEYLSSLARHNTRIVAGHPEGFVEAFANIYRNVASLIQARMAGTTPAKDDLDYPDIYAGLRGMIFQYLVVESSEKKKWIRFPEA